MDGGDEVIFDWVSAPFKDLILPPGVVTLKARVRDRLGAATAWLPSGQLEVGVLQNSTSAPQRRLLAAGRRGLGVDVWEQGRQVLQNAIDLQDHSMTNQLINALAGESAQMNHILLQMLYSSAGAAVKTAGYVCEVLSVAKSMMVFSL